MIRRSRYPGGGRSRHPGLVTAGQVPGLPKSRHCQPPCAATGGDPPGHSDPGYKIINDVAKVGLYLDAISWETALPRCRPSYLTGHV
jgi:hypothetical protein